MSEIAAQRHHDLLVEARRDGLARAATAGRPSTAARLHAVWVHVRGKRTVPAAAYRRSWVLTRTAVRA